MILSVHIRKCAGTSFRDSLVRAFGSAVLFDYGDQIGTSWPSAVARRMERSVVDVERLCGVEVIHGHYLPQKYDCLEGPKTRITMLRDPVARVVSNYHYIKRHPDRAHADALIVNMLGFSLIEFAQHPDNRNVQTQCLGGLGLDGFAVVGLVEDYARSLRHLSEVLRRPLRLGDALNVNSNAEADYVLSRKERAAIENANLDDLRLYEAARNRFERQCAA